MSDQTIPVLWLSRYPDTILARGYADQGLLEAIFDRSLYRPPNPLTFSHHIVHGDDPWPATGAVVIPPARHHSTPDDLIWFLGHLNALDWSLVILSGDEEWNFPWQQIPETPTRRVWTMQPIAEHSTLSGTIPGGWYPQTRDLLAPHHEEAITRPLDWFFAGQITHQRRRDLHTAARRAPNGRLEPTRGYLQEAVTRAEYFKLMASSKIIPCPSGPMTVDTARAFEALEAGCVPLLDARRPNDPQFDYWTLLFGPHPYPTVEAWGDFRAHLGYERAKWPINVNLGYSFWQRYKRNLAFKLDFDIRAVASLEPSSDSPDDLITVIVTSSPVPRHPSTDHLELTLDSIRNQLPQAEIILVFDGIRPEQAYFQRDYQEYIRRALWLTNFRYPNVYPIVMEHWGHQANATRLALESLTTPLLLFVEHDTPLCDYIDWSGICRVLRSGTANAIRLHFDPAIHPDQDAIMIDKRTRNIDGVPLRRTAAWWQRPHVARADFYRNKILGHIQPTSRTMIEEPTYQRMWIDCDDRGDAGWNYWRVWMYTPDGSFKRSDHLNSRADEPKFGMRP